MHIRLIAVGDRQPAWVDEAFQIYSQRFPREWRFQLTVIKAPKHSGKQPAANAVARESREILKRLTGGERLVLLDERGTELSSRELALKLGDWQGEGRDISFLIGGPDGVSADCRARADDTWSLSRLTLPHGLIRVLFAEQLYRAWSLQAGHPYHRD